MHKLGAFLPFIYKKGHATLRCEIARIRRQGGFVSRPQALTQLNGMDWLVEARNDIQSFMLRLHKQWRKEWERSEPASEDLRKWNLFLGVAFSLWRAVFLVEPSDIERQTGKLAKDAKDFLETVINTNSITFTDDRLRRAWSSGYYLNNARLRLKAIVPLQEHISNAVLKDVWCETFDALEKAFGDFERGNL